MKELISAVTNQSFGYVPKMKVSTNYCFKLRKNHYRNAFFSNSSAYFYSAHVCICCTTSHQSLTSFSYHSFTSA